MSIGELLGTVVLLPIFSCIRQLQELESKFKDFYSQSLSNKDDRIKVLDSRIEELTDENHQQKQEIKDLRMSIDRLKEVGSPRIVSRTHSPREMNRLKEQAADALRLRDKFHAIQEEVSIHVHVILFRNMLCTYVHINVSN